MALYVAVKAAPISRSLVRREERFDPLVAGQGLLLIARSAFIAAVGARVLTDPVWGERISPVRIAGPKGHLQPRDARAWDAPAEELFELAPERGE